MTRQATVAEAARDLLGEGPEWDPRAEMLRWVDIDRGLVFEARYRDGELGTRRIVHRSDGPIGAIARTRAGGLLVAERRDLVHVDGRGREVGRFRVLPEGVASRLNDGACDPAGRFLVGSLALDGRTGRELLVRLEPDGRITIVDDDLTLSNGLGWSPDGGTMYSVDSVPGVVWARDYDPSGDTVGARRLLFEVGGGVPDGLTIDAEGNLWIAIWGAGEVRCYTPAGRLLDAVTTSAPYPTATAFAGSRLDRLFITSAGKAVDGQPPHPDAGRVFVARPGVRGRATPAWTPVHPRMKEAPCC